MSASEMNFIDLSGLSQEEVFGVHQNLKDSLDVFCPENNQNSGKDIIACSEYNNHTNNRRHVSGRRYNNNNNNNNINNHKNYNKNNYNHHKPYINANNNNNNNNDNNNNINYNNNGAINGDFVEAIQNLNIEASITQQQHHQQHPQAQNTMNIPAYSPSSLAGNRSNGGLPQQPIYNNHHQHHHHHQQQQQHHHHNPQQHHPQGQPGAQQQQPPQPVQPTAQQPYVFQTTNGTYTARYTPQHTFVSNAPSIFVNSPTSACDKQDYNNHQYSSFPQAGHVVRLPHHQQSQTFTPNHVGPYPVPISMLPYHTNWFAPYAGFPAQHLPQHQPAPQQQQPPPQPQTHQQSAPHNHQLANDVVNYDSQRYPYVFPQPHSPHMVFTANTMIENYQNHQQISTVTPPPSNVSSSPLTINSNQNIENETISDSPQSVTPVNNQDFEDDDNDDDAVDVVETLSQSEGLVNGIEEPEEQQPQQQQSTEELLSENDVSSSFNPIEAQITINDSPVNNVQAPEPEIEESKPGPKVAMSWASIASKKVPPKPSQPVRGTSQSRSTRTPTVSESHETQTPAPLKPESPTPTVAVPQQSGRTSITPTPTIVTATLATATTTSTTTTTTTTNNTVAVAEQPIKPEKKSKKSKKADAINNIVKIKVDDDPFAIKIVERITNYKLNHAYPAIVPSGLINRGNYCYINAVLQALLASPPFYNLMRDLGCSLHGIFRPESCTPILDSFVRFFTQFPPSHDLRSKLKNAQQSNTLNTYLDSLLNNPFEPIFIRQALKFIGMTNEQGLQEDAEEFFSNVLNGMNDEFIAMSKFFESRENGDHFDGETNADEDESDDNLWKEVGTRGKNKTLLTRTANVVSTPISDIFQGFTLDTRTIANQSKEPSVGNRQPFFSLQVDIKAPSIKTLEDALRWRTQSETIDGYICSQTKQTIQASSQTFLEVLPPILVLHLNLFDYDPATNSSSKVLKRIQFEESFEVPKECLSRSHRNPRKYKLLAVVSHSGTEAQKGHYITEVYHVGLNKWLRCDDSNVKVTDLNQVLKGGETNLVPYLLFYRRYDTIAREGDQYKERNNNNNSDNTNNFVSQNRYLRN